MSQMQGSQDSVEDHRLVDTPAAIEASPAAPPARHRSPRQGRDSSREKNVEVVPPQDNCEKKNPVFLWGDNCLKFRRTCPASEPPGRATCPALKPPRPRHLPGIEASSLPSLRHTKVGIPTSLYTEVGTTSVFCPKNPSPGQRRRSVSDAVLAASLDSVFFTIHTPSQLNPGVGAGLPEKTHHRASAEGLSASCFSPAR